MKKGISFLLFFFIVISNIAKGQINIEPKDKRLTYMGRVELIDSTAEMYWSGSSVKLNFEGTGLKAVLKDERADNFFNVIIDRDSVCKLKLDTAKRQYVLASNLPAGKHSIELYKITEYDRGKVSFYGFQSDKGKVLKPSPAQKRKIEFYGNSITCGYAVEDTLADSPASIYQNNYLSYAALTARHYNAAYSFIAKSGIGITISWFPYTMPEIYDRLNPTDSNSKWDFSGFSPDIVVVNLFQNDSWLVNKPDHVEFKRIFGTLKPMPELIITSYRKFIQNLRVKYPKAHIICALGNMDATKPGSPWPGYIEKAIELLQDKKIYTHFFLYKNTKGHPKVREQQIMADSLIHFIDAHIKW